MTSNADQEGAASVAAIELAPGWRLFEDGELQWLLQREQPSVADERNRWRTVAYCGTKEGLLEVALPHHSCQPTDDALLRLKSLPEHYLPGALAQIDDDVIITGPQHRSQQSLRRPGREAAQ